MDRFHVHHFFKETIALRVYHRPTAAALFATNVGVTGTLTNLDFVVV